MPNIWLIADTHFGHAGVCKFTDANGEKIRPWNCPDEMDEEIISRFNNCVKPKDKTYFLGDVVINRRCLHTIGRLNGEKVLVKGNHDIFKADEYLTYFKDIRAYHVLNNMLMSHIPVHCDSKGRFRANIHGHTHTNKVMSNGIIDPWYFCVCVEQINYTPITLEEVNKQLAERCK